MPGRIWNFLSMFLRKIRKTQAQKSPPKGKGFFVHIACEEQMRERHLKSSSRSVISCSSVIRKRKWGSDSFPHPANLKLGLLTGKWKCYDSETFIFNLCSFLMRIQLLSSNSVGGKWRHIQSKITIKLPSKSWVT